MNRFATFGFAALLGLCMAQDAFGWGAVSGPRGGAAYRGPAGGAAVRGPNGGEAVRGPYGAVRGPRSLWRRGRARSVWCRRGERSVWRRCGSGPYGGAAVRGALWRSSLCWRLQAVGTRTLLRRCRCRRHDRCCRRRHGATAGAGAGVVLVLVQPGAEPRLLGLLLLTAAREDVGCCRRCSIRDLDGSCALIARWQVNQVSNTDYTERKVKPQITQSRIVARFAQTRGVALRESH